MSDEESKHNVLLVGIARIAAGPDGAAELLARHFQIPVAAGHRLVERLPAIVKRNVGEEDARMLQGALRGLGFDVTVVPTRQSVSGQFEAAPASSARLRSGRPRSTGAFAIATGSHAVVDSAPNPMSFAAAQPARQTAPHPTVETVLGIASPPTVAEPPLAPPPPTRNRLDDGDGGEPDVVEKVELKPRLATPMAVEKYDPSTTRFGAPAGDADAGPDDAADVLLALVEAAPPAAPKPKAVAPQAAADVIRLSDFDSQSVLGAPEPEPPPVADMFDARPPTGTARHSVLEELASIGSDPVPGGDDPLSMSSVFGTIKPMVDSSIGLEAGPTTPFAHGMLPPASPRSAADSSAPSLVDSAGNGKTDDRTEMMSDLEESLREVAGVYVPPGQASALGRQVGRPTGTQRVVVDGGLTPGSRVSTGRLTGAHAPPPPRPQETSGTPLVSAAVAFVVLAAVALVAGVMWKRSSDAASNVFGGATSYYEWRFAPPGAVAWFAGCSKDEPGRFTCRYSPEFYAARVSQLDGSLTTMAAEQCSGVLEVAGATISTTIDCELEFERGGRTRTVVVAYEETEACLGPKADLAPGASVTCSWRYTASVDRADDDEPAATTQVSTTASWRFDRARTAPTPAGYFSDAREYVVTVGGTTPRVVVVDAATGLVLLDTPAGRDPEVSVSHVRLPGRTDGTSRWAASE